MTSFASIPDTLLERHRKSLRWFEENRKRRVSWEEIKAQASNGTRLVTQAKGIYKPAYTEFALSVRTLQDSPYPDKDVEYRADGSWVCQYYQENPDPKNRDREATNRGLMQCMAHRVPVGYLVKRKPKPGVEYDIIGLGLVVDWSEGYFTIEGLAPNGTVHHKIDAARARAVVPTPHDEDFIPGDATAPRERAIKDIAIRRGQAAFRAKLLETYGGRCCVTGCDLSHALEAAHIEPYSGPASNHPQNGLLLRADIHTLFDLGLLAVDQHNCLLIAPALSTSTAYRDLAGQRLSFPKDRESAPSRQALKNHRLWAAL
ncbi:HNH endonuclease [Salipiger pacificus]|nr:HNH endonuclease [Alloyangia pacifica]